MKSDRNRNRNRNQQNSANDPKKKRMKKGKNPKGNLVKGKGDSQKEEKTMISKNKLRDFEKERMR